MGKALAKVMPATDVNGDIIDVIDRGEVFTRAWGVIRPVRHHFYAIRYKDNQYPDDKRLTRVDEVGAGRGDLLADLNTPEGRAAFLQCWWPDDQDGACVVWTAQKAEDAPYPVWSQIRTAAIWLRPEPDLMQCTYRFGAWQPTTTGLKALWDIGIRRLLWYPNPHLEKWLRDHGAGPKMQALDPSNPYCTREFGPQHVETKAAFFVDLSARPVTDDYMAWLGGQA
jgi:hypothetical protein